MLVGLLIAAQQEPLGLPPSLGMSALALSRAGIDQYRVPNLGGYSEIEVWEVIFLR